VVLNQETGIVVFVAVVFMAVAFVKKVYDIYPKAAFSFGRQPDKKEGILCRW